MKYILIFIRTYCTLLLLFASLFCFPTLTLASPEEAVFAGGCFWCLEHDLEGLSGVSSVESGYTGGISADPTYRNHQGHQEAVVVYFDPLKISYEKLLRSYWRNVDPLDGGGQFCDRGDSYRPVIFTRGERQQRFAIQSRDQAAQELGKPINSLKVEIKDAKKFWLAEEYHQNYAKRNSLKYKFYRSSCGRDSRLEKLWGERAKTKKERPGSYG